MGTDCLGLALMVQREMFGRMIPDIWQYDAENFRERSLIFPAEMLALGFVEVDTPSNGDVCFAIIAGTGHVFTFLYGAHLTITQYTTSTWKLRKLPFRYFRPGGVKLW